MRLICQVIRSAKVVPDNALGASVGWFSLLIKKRHGRGLGNAQDGGSLDVWEKSCPQICHINHLFWSWLDILDENFNHVFKVNFLVEIDMIYQPTANFLLVSTYTRTLSYSHGTESIAYTAPFFFPWNEEASLISTLWLVINTLHHQNALLYTYVAHSVRSHYILLYLCNTPHSIRLCTQHL